MAYIVHRSYSHLCHAGVAHDENPPGRGSGRYPFGSGKKPFQHDKSLKDFNLTDKQKKYLRNGAIAVGVGLAVIGGVYLLNSSGSLGPLIEKGKRLTLEKVIGYDIETGLKKSNKGVNINEINTGYGKILSHSTNCGNCCIAFELQNRGFKVRAKGNEYGISIPQIGQFFNGLHSKSFLQFDSLEELVSRNNDLKSRGNELQSIIGDKILNQFPEGSRGTLFLTKSDFSHWISWDIKNGNIQFYDPQNPSVDFSEMFGKYTYIRKSINNMTAIRLDDLSINSNNIHSVVENIHSNKLDSRINSIINKINKINIEDFKGYISEGNNFLLKNPDIKLSDFIKNFI